MLHKITIENFFSIADCQELTFGVPDHTPNLSCFRTSRSNGETRLPTVIGFFGANASGKSTILRAAISSVIFALFSFGWVDQITALFQPYRRKDWWDKPTKITLDFDSQLNSDAPSTIFRYELHIAHQANQFGNKVISYEALHYAPKGKFRRLFERHYQNFHFGREFDIPNANDPRAESIRPNASVISTLAQLNHPISLHLCQLIGTTQTNYISVSKVQPDTVQWLAAYYNDKSCLDRLNRELRRLDIGLESMTVELGGQDLFAKFHHTGLDGFILLEEESQGTQSFIKIFPRLHYVLETGSVAIIDELDTDFHPLVLPEILRWFSDPERNPHNAQLLFTGHNPALLDELEKEQVFFTEKPSGQPTHVYGACDIKGLRREPSLMKKYLSGELGAVPHIG